MRKCIKTLSVIILVTLQLLAGFPSDAVMSYLHDRNIVDVMYHSMQSSQLVDNALMPVVKPAQATGATDMMMAYDNADSTSIPKYREWNGSAWGTEASANAVNGEIRHMQIKYAPTRDEAIMVVLTSTGEIQAQVWGGSSWGSVSVLGTTANANGDRDLQSLYRGFDIEYEQSSGDAVVVYGDGTADPNYDVWNGSAWAGATDINIPTTGVPTWIEMASRTGTDDLAFILVDANADIYGMRWTGSAWNNMSVATAWDTTAGTATRKCVDVAFENGSGEINFVWGDGTATTHLNYRAYQAGSLGSVTAIANANQGGINQWLRIAATPEGGVDSLIMAGVDAGADLNSWNWNGSAWSAAHTEHSAAVENIIDMNFDIAYETHSNNPGNAWIAFGNGTTLTVNSWDGSSWIGATTSDDDTANVVLNAQPNSGAFFALSYDDDTATNDDIRELHLTGGSSTYTSSASIWGGPVARRLGYFRTAVASQAYNSSTEAMMVYDTQTITAVPKYRQWTGSSWGSEGSASTVDGEIRHMVTKCSPTRNECILATLGSTGLVQAQVWSGSSWAAASTIGTMNDANNSRDTQSLYRGFDLEYELTSGDAILIYGDGSADPNYDVWNGSGWAGATNIDIPTTGRVNWIELANQTGSTSDELAFITLDANADVYGMRWTGSAWNNMSVATAWDTTGPPATRKGIDVAFERNSGEIMWMWGDATATTQMMYRAYQAGALGSATALANANQGGINQWLRIAANPDSSSNQIMAAGLDAGADLNTWLWTGSAWNAVDAEHSAATEDVVDMNFDLIFETSSGNLGDAWLVWGNGTTVTQKEWNGSAWSGSPTTSGDDTAYIRLATQPTTGAVQALIYEDDTGATDDIDEIHLTGGSKTWSSLADVWTGPIRRNLGLSLMDVTSELYTPPADPTFTQSTYRWYVDSDAQNVTDPWGNPDLAENAPITIIPATNAPPTSATELRLRVAMTVNTNPLVISTQQFKMQYKAGTDSSCTTGSWTDVGAAAGAEIWRFAASSVTTGTAITAAKLTPTDVLEVYSKANPTVVNPIAATATQDIEYDFHLEHNAAADNTQYSFRLVESDGTVFDAYTTCPTLTTAPATANLMRHGSVFQNETKKGFFWAN